MAADAVLVNEIPAEGAAVYELQISFPDSSIGGSGGYFGTVFCNREGIVILRCPGWGNDETESLVTAISLYDAAGNLIYEASAGEGIGRITYMEDGELVFTSFSPDGHTAPVPIVLEEPVPAETLCGLTLAEIRSHSHRPQDFYGKPHFMPEVSDGEAVLGLNRVRGAARYAELTAAAAFQDENGLCTRTDILQALNRISSMLYILMIKAKP
jgi:hypothetical protein